MNQVLKVQLNDAWRWFEITENYDSAINNLKAELPEEKEYKRLKEVKKSMHTSVGVAILFSFFLSTIVFVIGMLAIAYIDNQLNWDTATMLITLFIVFPFVTFFVLPCIIITPFVIYSKMYCKKENVKLKTKATQYWHEVALPALKERDENLNNLTKERDEFLEKSANIFDFLPEKYRTKLAIAYMSSVVDCGRADTLKEAMNLFEEQLHRWNLEASAQRLVEEQQFQNFMVNQQLSDIADSQRRSASSLRDIENMEFYNTFCR